MADDENKQEVTEKEKESAKEEEKDKDTASKPGSARSGKPGSAKSAGSKSARSSSPKSPKPGAKSPIPKTPKDKGRGKKKDDKKASKDEEKKADAADGAEEKEEGLPEGVIPIFLATKSQEIYQCKADEDVTEAEPFKFIKKEEILHDLKMRAGVCDFSVIKPIVLEYPGEEILVMYDADFKHGQNFVVATTEEAKEKLQHINDVADEEGAGEEGKGEEEDIVYRYIPPEPKEWISQGSEREIEEESFSENRKNIKISVKRIRREFGAPYKFSDRNVADAKDGFIDCVSYEDKTFELKKAELDKSTQAIPEFQDVGCQTDWKHPRNAASQYFPRTFTDHEKEEFIQSEVLQKFVTDAVPRFELALQQNEIMDVFFDDWANLGGDDISFGSKADNHLKEYQSFTDLQFSKDKTITCIDWHPTNRGIIAVSVAEKMKFDERIDNAARVIMTPSLLLIWSFTDPIHPQLLLEAPDDIYAFKFCPTDPNIIAGGCINGQVVLWDISAHADRLKTQRSRNLKKNLNTIPGFEDASALDTPIVRYCAVSSIEHSHRAIITDVQWVPDHMELTRMGVPQENKSGQCVQLMTCATDHCVLVWDTRPPKGYKDPKADKMHNPMGIPTTFKHLDLTWKPWLKITLSKSEPGGDHSPTKFSIQEVQGDKSVLNDLDDEKLEDKPSQGGFSFGGPKPGSGVKRTLKGVNTHFYIGTEDGEVVYADWMPQKDQDTGKVQTPKPDYYHVLHDGSVSTLQRSPFFKDVILCVGGWTFTVWKEGILSGPILSSAGSPIRLTGGFWSPTRPAVFFITRQDGSIDIWDLLDRTHEPSISQSVSPAVINCIFPYQVTPKQHLLAVGDSLGTLHILEIPWSLRQPTPNELTGMTNYIEREVKRRSFVVARWDFREKEKREIEAQAKLKAGIAPMVILTDEEIEYRMKQDYAAFLEEESTFLRELGLKDDADEPLPET